MEGVDYEGVRGDYKFQSAIPRTGIKFAGTHVGGASVGTWRKVGDIDGRKHLISIGSTDVWGSIWQISACPYRVDDEDNDGDWEYENKRVLYRWENGIFNSLIPPKQGWKLVNISDDSANQPVEIHYTIGRKKTLY